MSYQRCSASPIAGTAACAALVKLSSYQSGNFMPPAAGDTVADAASVFTGAPFGSSSVSLASLGPGLLVPPEPLTGGVWLAEPSEAVTNLLSQGPASSQSSSAGVDRLDMSGGTTSSGRAMRAGHLGSRNIQLSQRIGASCSRVRTRAPGEQPTVGIQDNGHATVVRPGSRYTSVHGRGFACTNRDCVGAVLAASGAPAARPSREPGNRNCNKVISINRRGRQRHVTR